MGKSEVSATYVYDLIPSNYLRCTNIWVSLSRPSPRAAISSTAWSKECTATCTQAFTIKAEQPNYTGVNLVELGKLNWHPTHIWNTKMILQHLWGISGTQQQRPHTPCTAANMNTRTYCVRASFLKFFCLCEKFHILEMQSRVLPWPQSTQKSICVSNSFLDNLHTPTTFTTLQYLRILETHHLDYEFSLSMASFCQSAKLRKSWYKDKDVPSPGLLQQFPNMLTNTAFVYVQT